MCITLLLLSPEYAASQQAEATSTPEEAAPQVGREGSRRLAKRVVKLVTPKLAIRVP